MKPVELVQKAVRNRSKNRGLVFDPFGGSGSTLIACETMGRKAWLIEIDPKYVDVIVKRWRDYTGRKPVLENDGREFEHISAERSCPRRLTEPTIKQHLSGSAC
jgi:DNA modification methylase